MGWRVPTAVATGRVKLKVAPWPSRLSTETWPPSNSTSRRTRARPRPVPWSCAALKRPKDIRQPLSFDAPARVAHEELHLVFLLLGLQQDGPVLRRVAHRIAHQIVHDAAQSPAISIHMREVGEMPRSAHRCSWRGPHRAPGSRHREEYRWDGIDPCGVSRRPVSSSETSIRSDIRSLRRSASSSAP